MDMTTAKNLFATAEITPDGEHATDQAFDEWLAAGADVAFYRAANGRVLARPAGRSHPPSTKVFSDRYDSATLIGVFPNPNPPMEKESEEPKDPPEEADDEPEDEDEDEDDDEDDDDFDDLVDAFTARWGDDKESRRPPVQTLNKRRARQFLLTALKTTSTRYGEPAFHDLLLARGHGLAFYTRLDYGQREFLCRHYGGPTPRLLPAAPPEILEEPWKEEWKLVSTYEGPALLGWNWKEQVSALPLESFLTVHAAGSGEYALRIRDEILELVRTGEGIPKTVTTLGPLTADDDPLALALQAVPDLLTFDPHTAVDITTDALFAVADTIRLSADPNRREMIDSLNQDDLDFFEVEEDVLIGYFDNLVPLRLRVNGILHFAARLDDSWALIPVNNDASFPTPVLTRTFLSISYDFDGGGISSGPGFETIGEIRPGLNVSWGDFQEEMWDRPLTLARGDLPKFAVEELTGFRFGRHILNSLLGVEDELPETDLDDDEELDETDLDDEERYYDFDEPEIGFEPRSEEGLRFLNALLELYGDDPDTAARIRALLNR
ncbi:hypothetical protein SAMN05216276_10679 [Streptosporangium subroseum]|uniref:Uncharacterized protein n=1 Tax=Streptosporangium subroseum TaxID=106412 RepID=A0A239NRJ5_9ACTN|nr:hypothetical protein [Streptosporangium subroseum]SNT57541.1 hypothetical protein SAMN05216276_10679 [Streptosporangium subroseum]